MAKNLEQQKERIQRFGKVARFAHWAHTVTFFVLAITGAVIFMKALNPIAVVLGGIQGARLIHRIMAVGFITLPLISLFFNFGGFAQWMVEVTTWGKNDVGFLASFPKEFFGLHVEAPPQGRFNAGEKINSLLQVIGCSLLGFSGIFIWFKELFPIALVRVALPIHDIAFILTFTAALGHMYLALVLPSSNHAINGMITGSIDEEFAKDHYPLWYERIKKEQT